MSIYLINITKTIILSFEQNQDEIDLETVAQNNKILKRLLFHFRIMKRHFSHRLYLFLLQNFIQSRLSYFYWIGLSRKGTRNQWTWEDKSLPFLKL